MRLRLLWLFLIIATASAQASSPYNEVVTFSYTQDVGFGNSVFVVGNILISARAMLLTP